MAVFNRLFLVLVVLCLSLSLVPLALLTQAQVQAQEQTQTQTTWQTYTSPGAGFSIKYPSDWAVNETTYQNGTIDTVSFDMNESVAANNSTTGAGVHVMAQSILIPEEKRAMSLENLSSSLLGVKQWGLRTLEITTSHFLGGFPAIKTVSIDMGHGFKTMAEVTRVGDILYDVIYATGIGDYDAYLLRSK